MKKKLGIVILTALVLCVGIGLTAFLVLRRQNELDRIQEAALFELEDKKGEYNENIILLSETSHARAKKLAKKFNASLRITKNGEFAALTLPEGVTVEDIYRDNRNRSTLEELSLDYHVYLAELETTDDETGDGLFRPNYQVDEPNYHMQSYLNYINIGDVWNNTLGSTADGEKVKGVSIEGCKYPLKNATLSNRYQYAVSNEITGNCTLISVKKGGIFIVESKNA